MTLTNSWRREPVVDLIEEMPEIEMKYIVSIVLCPDMFNIGIQRRINKINNPDLFTDPLEVIEEIKEIHKIINVTLQCFLNIRFHRWSDEIWKEKAATKTIEIYNQQWSRRPLQRKFWNYMEKSSLVFAKFISVKVITKMTNQQIDQKATKGNRYSWRNTNRSTLQKIS